MPTTIKLKNSVTTTAAPSSLVQGEVASNITDRKLWVGDASSTPVQILGAGAPVAGTTGTFTGNTTVAGTFAANGGTTLGDASGDALTINSSAVSIPNGLNFDSNTLVIDATNNRVGVGVASPATRLDAFGNGETNIAKLVGGGNLTLYSYHDAGGVGWATGAASSYVNMMYMDSTNNFRIFTNSAERMRIDSAGRVGIGITSPGSYYANNLVVGVFDQGGITIANSSTTGENLLAFADSASGADRYTGFIGYSHTTNAMRFATNGGTEAMRITSAGNVGIGTSSPIRRLDVRGTNSTFVDASTTFYIKDDTAFATNVGGGISFGGNIDGSSTLQTFATVQGIKENATSGNLLGALRFTTSIANGNPTEKMRLDSSGNLGLGVTPQVWNSNHRVFELAGVSTAHVVAYVNGLSSGTNYYLNSGGTTTYAFTGQNATRYWQTSSGQHQWYNAPSGTAGNAITFTQAMTLDASGNLGIGTTSPDGRLDVEGRAFFKSTSDIYALSIGYGSSASAFYYIGASANTSPDLIFSNGLPSEAMRLTHSGNLLVNRTSRLNNGKIEVLASTSEQGVVAQVQSNGNSMFQGFNSSGTAVFYATGNGVVYISGLGTGTVYSNGGLLTNTNPSDERLKKDISNVSWGLDAVTQLRPVSYKWKTDTVGQGEQYGFIAQEVQSVMPELVREFETKDGEETVTRLGLEKDGIIVAMVKAIQELKAEFDAYKATHP
jgi:hypothetical protein